MKKIMLVTVLIIISLSGCRSKEDNGELASYKEKVIQLEAEKEIVINENKINLDELYKKSNECKQELMDMKKQMNEIEDNSIIKNEVNGILLNQNLTYFKKVMSQDYSIATISDGENSGTYLIYNSNDEIELISEYAFEPIWSFNGNACILDEGSSINRKFKYMFFGDDVVIEDYDYVDTVLWLNNDYLIYTKANPEIKLEPITELEYTTNMTLLNLMSREETIIAEGTDEYVLFIRSVNNNEITFERFYVGNSDKNVIDTIDVSSNIN